MTRIKVNSPVKDFTGTVVGVDFLKGVGEVDTVEQTSAVHYFRRHGYGVPEYGTAEHSDKAPAKSASKADWVAYAIAQGVDADEAEASTRDALAERFNDQGTED